MTQDQDELRELIYRDVSQRMVWAENSERFYFGVLWGQARVKYGRLPWSELEPMWQRWKREYGWAKQNARQ